MSVAGVVRLEPEDVFAVSCEAVVDGQCVVVEAEDDVSLRVEKVRGRRGAGVELPAFVLRRDARIGNMSHRGRGCPSRVARSGPSAGMSRGRHGCEAFGGKKASRWKTRGQRVEE